MKQQMKAAVLTGPKKIEIKHVAVPEPREGEIEIQITACGVCGSDIHMWKAGKGWSKEEIPDFIMGHEFAGIVTNPNGSQFKKGERVTLWASLYCGHCDMCRQGQEHLCRHIDGTNYVGFVCNGGYTERFVGKAMNADRLPDTVSDIAAACIDPLMVAYHAVRHSGIKLNDRVLVVGNGIIGNMIAELAKKSGASYVAMAKLNDTKLAPTKKAGYVDGYFTSTDEDIQQKLQQAAPAGFDLAFEAVGSAQTLDLCLHAMKPGSSVVMIGNSMTETIPVNINYAVLHEISLKGSVSCTREEFRETIDLIANGVIDPEQYVTDIVSLDDLQHAFERLTSPDDPILKAVVKP